MRILLRDPQTGLFFSSDCKWVEDPASAQAFRDTNRAIDEAFLTGLDGVEIVMRFDNPAFEIPLTIAGRQAERYAEPALNDGLREADLPPTVAG